MNGKRAWRRRRKFYGGGQSDGMITQLKCKAKTDTVQRLEGGRGRRLERASE